jgi:hypothetical protein
MEIEMTMELTFDAVRAPKRHALPRLVPRPAREAPADDAPKCERDVGPAQGWGTANRGLRHIEDALAAVVFAGLLALGTLTFGYAFDGLAAAHAAGAPAAVAVNR